MSKTISMCSIEKNEIRLPISIILDFQVFECMTQTVETEFQGIHSLACFVKELSLDFNLCFKSYKYNLAEV